jgi:general secretion pathway protein D
LVIVDDLISALDVEQQDLRALRLYDIQYVGAEEVRDKLIELGIIGATTTRRGQSPYLSRQRRSATEERTTAAQQAARPPSPPSTSRSDDEEPLTEEPQVVIVESTNSLLVNATAEQHTQIAMIISYVDTETIAQAVPYEIYQLENQKPEDLAEVLNKLIQETIRDKEGKIEQTIKKIDEDIVIVPDASTFSLIVYANKKNQEWISRLIKTLDKRRPQVLIDVSMVEINREDLFEYDLNIITNARNAVLGNVGVAGKILPIEDSVGDFEFGWNQIANTETGNPTGQLKGFYSSDKIQAILTAMQKHNYGRLLAQPKVLVNDNEQGIISTSETTYVTETTTTVIPGSDTPQQGKKFIPYDAKVELKITPTISEGSLLRLEIEMLSEDFVPQEDVPPDYRRSNLTTVVTVPNGSTIILGGLSKLKQTKGGSKVPILGDIPIVGNLFRTVSDSDKSNKLYLFVRADILRPDDTLGLGGFEEIAARNRREFEREEELFQQKESFVGIKSEPMDPLRILEAE